jgi:hypothetical protein
LLEKGKDFSFSHQKMNKYKSEPYLADLILSLEVDKDYCLGEES